jgi:hypothetical protein
MKPRSLTPLSLDTVLVEALDRLLEGRLRQSERDVVYAPGVRRGSSRVRLALLIGEDRDQAPVARVEVEVALRGVVEVGLLEDEGHSEHALPEVDRRLAVGAHDRDVVASWH